MADAALSPIAIVLGITRQADQLLSFRRNKGLADPCRSTAVGMQSTHETKVKLV